MEKLLAFLPKKEGTILDVACGKGATTRYLLRYFKSENVTGINISEKQLARCRENAPGCTFLLMSATELKFADESFDNISCVEAAFHFVTREIPQGGFPHAQAGGTDCFARRALCKTQRRTRRIAVRSQ
jgi:MPBQ/MSBQ methyltransferase